MTNKFTITYQVENEGDCWIISYMKDNRLVYINCYSWESVINKQKDLISQGYEHVPANIPWVS